MIGQGLSNNIDTTAVREAMARRGYGGNVPMLDQTTSASAGGGSATPRTGVGSASMPMPKVPSEPDTNDKIILKAMSKYLDKMGGTPNV